MVGALTQSYIKNSGSKIRLHKTLTLAVFSFWILYIVIFSRVPAISEIM